MYSYIVKIIQNWEERHGAPYGVVSTARPMQSNQPSSEACLFAGFFRKHEH
jgi:hypothetical protein